MNKSEIKTIEEIRARHLYRKGVREKNIKAGRVSKNGEKKHHMPNDDIDTLLTILDKYAK